MSTDMRARVDRLDAMIEEGRVLREQWTDGHERACLLTALSPEAGRAGHASACPAHVMPAWLAHLTPWVDDSVSADAWPVVIRRYAALARRWGVLDDAAWERARVASLIAIVSEARLHCRSSDERALAALDGILEWLRSGAPESERVAASRAAASAAVAAASKAAAASWAASWSWAAALAAAAAAAAAAAEEEAASWAEEEAASWAAEAVAAKAAVAAVAAVAAKAAAAAVADRIATAVLNAIEAEIEREE